MGIASEPAHPSVRPPSSCPTIALGVTSTLKYRQRNNIFLFPLQTVFLAAKFVPFPPAATPRHAAPPLTTYLMFGTHRSARRYCVGRPQPPDPPRSCHPFITPNGSVQNNDGKQLDGRLCELRSRPLLTVETLSRRHGATPPPRDPSSTSLYGQRCFCFPASKQQMRTQARHSPVSE